MNYLYLSTIQRYTDSVQDQAEVTDFEALKSGTVLVSNIFLAENTFIIEEPYDTFKTHIVAPIAWGDVRRTELGKEYKMYLITGEAL
jgi:hypothetical protein